MSRGEKIQAFFASATTRWYFWASFFLVALALPVAKSITRELPPPPPVLAEIPEFSAQDESGNEFALTDLRGKVWIANFIFTSCAEVCPRMSTRMREVQERLSNVGEAAHLVSISVDPDRDTPQRLAEYAERFNAKAGFWSFLTGAPEEIEAVVEDGFKIALELTRDEETGFFDIVHGEHFVLVDQLGRIRGYYDSKDDTEIQRLLNELGYLANLGPLLPGEQVSVLQFGAGETLSASR